MYTSSVFRFNMFKNQIHQNSIESVKYLLKVRLASVFPSEKQLLQYLAYKYLNIALTME